MIRVALSRVVNGAAGISADMDLRLVNSTQGSWYAMQGNSDIWQPQQPGLLADLDAGHYFER